MKENVEVELFISCQNLPKADLLTKSDPYYKLFTGKSKDGKKVKYTEYFKSETKKNEHNPEWKKPVKMKYFFEEKQYLKIEVYDDDNVTKDSKIAKKKFVLANVIGSRGKIWETKLESSKDDAKLIIRAEEIPNDKRSFTLKLRVEEIPKTRSFGFKYDRTVFYRLITLNEDKEKIIYESESIEGKNIVFKEHKIPFIRIEKKEIRIAFIDEKKNKEVCSIRTNSETLKKGEVLSMIKRDGTPLEETKLYIEKADLLVKYSLVEFFNSGLQINCIAAVDFTGSNVAQIYQGVQNLHTGNPINPILPGSTPYERAITSIGRILLDYDSDKLIPLFGFGAQARIPGIQFEKNCFALNLDEKNPSVFDLEGIHKTYLDILDKIDFSGPTYFSPILRKAIELTKENKFAYTILVLLTDGDNHDMYETITEIFNAAELPLSVLIIGIGNDEFQNMKFLDGDEESAEGKLRRENETLKRDLVQFVEFRKFDQDNKPIGALARELLAEIPDQVSQYFAGKQISPVQLSEKIQKKETDIPIVEDVHKTIETVKAIPL
eukprot:maker-scaffold_10-snap-gene-4.19-mRNA-1 protein AED:0.13 eAED:0.13 QI:0/0/0/1/1/1/5/0/548